MIRPYQESDREAMRRITTEVFGPSAIDYHIEQQHGELSGHDWRWRKLRQIDDDIRSNAPGIFVYEEPVAGGGGTSGILGYITVMLDRQGGIGRIPNLAVSGEAQGRGIGRKLIQHALDYIKSEGLEMAKIETLVGNAVGEHLYPAMGFEEVVRQIHYVKRLK